ncbi:endonuclease/exonuclease/phosphatase family protein [Nodosilinea sp. LEGE 07088]|uniref:endonuclease/exonuclease/phosphatase family protein n=1 Tax=Nodosilinea sp. LEGE 07088 TaxID=2777968 RepID=UPI00187F3164|nr:endonuclease/exonuclease/phosphatase family protein [Nodosilinea sp. LEGE 07088]MBE9140591.1 endonuclease/exonuclease/phosphatase family protein [Nodosilinea sp. LEGE 07088]
MAQKQSRSVSVFAWFMLMAVVGITAIALLSSRYGWPIYLELLSHFQLQYWVLSLVGLSAIALTRRRVPIWIGIACVAALTTQLVPWYWPLHFLGARDQGNFRILIANVNTQNRNFDAVINLAQQENPDLALFMEVNDRWVNHLDTLLAQMPHFAGETSDGNFGIVVYSRYPLEAVELIDFAQSSTPSITANLSAKGQVLTLVGTHPLPPVRPDTFHSRNRQFDQLGQYLQTLDGPIVLMGDFNASMWSPYYQRLKRQTRLRNVRRGFGLLPTWPVGDHLGWMTQLLAIPIDHGLLSPELTVVDARVGPDVGSDHRPVLIDLRL